MKRFVLSLFLLVCGIMCAAQELAVSTNMADYANFGTLNVDASYGFSQHWSVMAGARYNPFSFPGGKEDLGIQNKQRAAFAGMRYWPWHIFSGWWLYGGIMAQEYNTGGILSPETSEGDRLGGSLAAGYTYMVNQHVNIEFGAGLWGGHDVYIVYACPTCGRLLSSGEKYFIMPDRLILALSYVF